MPLLIYLVLGSEKVREKLRGCVGWRPAASARDTKANTFFSQIGGLDCTPEVRHDNYSDRHFKDDLWQYKERTVSFRRPTK